MKCSITVCGVAKEFENLDIGRAVHFRGAGMIVASAISHESKNRYTVCLICERTLHIRSGITLHDAIVYLQYMYDKYGVLA
ncbi:MAG: hypothetical protein IJ308_03600 [Clostridia bacterium]|nr:hypothetical protein [Clostridia bacterium]